MSSFAGESTEPTGTGAQSADGTKAEAQPPTDQVQERRRSLVRILFTYTVTGAYVWAALYLIWFLTQGAQPERIDIALGIFAGLSSVATGVIGFWFGNRKAVQDIRAYTAPPATGAPVAGKAKTP